MKASDCAHFVYHAARMKLSASYRVPYTVNLQLQLRCPFSCLYCAQEHASPARLPLEAVEGILHDAKAMGGKRVHLTGGEPTLYEGFDRVVGLARELGFFISLTTNGVAADERIDTLRTVDQIQLSFDGPDDVREELCGQAAADISAHALERFEREGLPFWTVTVLNRANLAHIDWIVDHADRHGTWANFTLMDPCPEVWNKANPIPEAVHRLLPSADENRAALRRLIELKKRGARVGSSLPYLQELLEWADYGVLTSPQASHRYRCRAWQSQCEVLADGDLHVCNWSLYRGLGQSVLRYGFRGAWERSARPEECRSCGSSCHLESNLIFDLNPATVWNWGKRLSFGAGRGSR